MNLVRSFGCSGRQGEQDVGNLLVRESDRHREHPIAGGREVRRLRAAWFWLLGDHLGPLISVGLFFGVGPGT